MVNRHQMRDNRQILGDLTREVKAHSLDPFEAYALFRQRIGYYDTYCSSSITSGGHARNNDYTMIDVIRKNTESAQLLVDELVTAGQLDPRACVEAVALGKTGWSQSQYMEFWLLVMSRLELKKVNPRSQLDEFRANLTQAISSHGEVIDMAAYNDGTLAAELRAPHYFRHADAFRTALDSYDFAPVTRVVRLVDPEQSLGAQTENYFARAFDECRVMRVAIAQVGGSTAHLTKADFPLSLVIDMDELIRFGSTVFDATSRKQLVLVNDVAQAAVGA